MGGPKRKGESVLHRRPSFAEIMSVVAQELASLQVVS
jgi:hypothetical protein